MLCGQQPNRSCTEHWPSELQIVLLLFLLLLILFVILIFILLPSP
jgi:hypothetical protein